MKRILITAGSVYGPLDSNKLVSNRARGIWAGVLAENLSDLGYQVAFLIPDTMASPSALEGQFGARFKALTQVEGGIKVIPHRGYWEYSDICQSLAREYDCYLLAAAVVNWIPAEPIEGKMKTDGYNEGDIINVPFVLAPRVINRVKEINPNLTLIGCKMLVGAEDDALVEAAYNVLLKGRCNVVVANDMKRGLKRKLLVYPDGSVQEFDVRSKSFYDALIGVIEDEHYHTVHTPGTNAQILTDPMLRPYLDYFGRVVGKYRDRFVHRRGGADRVFGSVLVGSYGSSYLTTPREKGAMFSEADATYVAPKFNWPERGIMTGAGAKATLNAPLLARVFEKYAHTSESCLTSRTEVCGVLHLHEQLPDVPTVDYAPPGTVRDNAREIPAPAFNIRGHGFVACIDANGEIIR